MLSLSASDNLDAPATERRLRQGRRPRERSPARRLSLSLAPRGSERAAERRRGLPSLLCAPDGDGQSQCVREREREGHTKCESFSGGGKSCKDGLSRSGALGPSSGQPSYPHRGREGGGEDGERHWPGGGVGAGAGEDRCALVGGGPQARTGANLLRGEPLLPSRVLIIPARAATMRRGPALNAEGLDL